MYHEMRSHVYFSQGNHLLVPRWLKLTWSCGKYTTEIRNTRTDHAPVTSELEDGWQRRSHNWSDRVHWTVKQNRMSDQTRWDLRYRVKV